MKLREMKKKKKELTKSKWSNQKKWILLSDAKKQRVERARARSIMCREKKKKTQNTTSDAKRNDEKGKKFSKVRP